MTLLYTTIATALFLATIAMPLLAPEGYEDDSGFHYGRPNP
jgi:hypothetical protein